MAEDKITITRKPDGQLIAKRGHVEWETPPTQPVPRSLTPAQLDAIVAHNRKYGTSNNRRA